jgi:hypothetical protein
MVTCSAVWSPFTRFLKCFHVQNFKSIDFQPVAIIHFVLSTKYKSSFRKNKRSTQKSKLCSIKNLVLGWCKAAV